MGVKVFVRDATGVVRAISPLNASVITFLIINWGIAISLLFVVTPAVLPGADLGVGLLACIPLVVLCSLSYVMMTEAMPRSGGDYVWMSRILNPAFATALEFMVVVFQGLFLGSIGVFTSNTVLAPGLGSIGLITGNSGLVSASSWFVTNQGVLIVGTLIVIITLICLIMPLRVYLKIQFPLWALGMLSVLVLLAIVLSTTHEGVVSAYNSFFAANNVTYTGVISAAQSAGFSNPGLVTWGSATLLSIPYLFWICNGFQYSSMMGGELKNVKRGMIYSSLVAGVLSAAVFAFCGFLFQGLLGADFLNAVAFLSSSGTYPAPVPFNPYFIAMMLDRNVVVDVLLLAGLTAWSVLIVTAGGLLYSRTILAWGFDRALPAKLGDVSERTHTPVVAVTIFCVLLELGVISTVYMGVIFANINLDLVLILLYAFAGLSAALFAYRRKSTFDMSVLKSRRIGGVPAITIIGAVNFVFFIILAYWCISYPSLSGPTGTLAFATMGGTFLAGLVLFLITRAYYKHRGIDVSLAFKEIPPE